MEWLDVWRSRHCSTNMRLSIIERHSVNQCSCPCQIEPPDLFGIQFKSTLQHDPIHGYIARSDLHFCHLPRLGGASSYHINVSRGACVIIVFEPCFSAKQISV